MGMGMGMGISSRKFELPEVTRLFPRASDEDHIVMMRKLNKLTRNGRRNERRRLHFKAVTTLEWAIRVSKSQRLMETRLAELEYFIRNCSLQELAEYGRRLSALSKKNLTRGWELLRREDLSRGSGLLHLLGLLGLDPLVDRTHWDKYHHDYHLTRAFRLVESHRGNVSTVKEIPEVTEMVVANYLGTDLPLADGYPFHWWTVCPTSVQYYVHCDVNPRSREFMTRSVRRIMGTVRRGDLEKASTSPFMREWLDVFLTYRDDACEAQSMAAEEIYKVVEVFGKVKNWTDDLYKKVYNYTSLTPRGRRRWDVDDFVISQGELVKQFIPVITELVGRRTDIEAFRSLNPIPVLLDPIQEHFNTMEGVQRPLGILRSEFIQNGVEHLDTWLKWSEHDQNSNYYKSWGPDRDWLTQVVVQL